MPEAIINDKPATNWLTTSQVIQRLPISRSTFRRLLEGGKIQGYKLRDTGTTWFFLEEDVMNLLRPVQYKRD